MSVVISYSRHSIAFPIFSEAEGTLPIHRKLLRDRLIIGGDLPRVLLWLLLDKQEIAICHTKRQARNRQHLYDRLTPSQRTNIRTDPINVHGCSDQE